MSMDPETKNSVSGKPNFNDATYQSSNGWQIKSDTPALTPKCKRSFENAIFLVPIHFCNGIAKRFLHFLICTSTSLVIDY